MPLAQPSLSTKIQAEIINLYGVADDAVRLKEFADAMAKAIVDEITQNAVVVGTVTGGGSSSGSAIAGTIT